VMAQPYQDFQDLAAQAESIRLRLTTLKDTYDLELYDNMYARLSSVVTEKYTVWTGHLQELQAMIDDTRSREGADFQNFSAKAELLMEKLVALRASQDRDARLAHLLTDLRQKGASYDQVLTRKKSSTGFGSVLLAGGLLGAASSLVFNYLAVSAYAEYSSAATSAEATDFRAKADAYNQYTMIAAGVGGGVAGLGTLFLLTRPDPTPLRRSIDELNRQIELLGGEK